MAYLNSDVVWDPYVLFHFLAFGHFCRGSMSLGERLYRSPLSDEGQFTLCELRWHTVVNFRTIRPNFKRSWLWLHDNLKKSYVHWLPMFEREKIGSIFIFKSWKTRSWEKHSSFGVCFKAGNWGPSWHNSKDPLNILCNGYNNVLSLK